LPWRGIAFTPLVAPPGIAHSHNRLHLPPENMSVDESKIPRPGATAPALSRVDGRNAGASPATVSISSKLIGAVLIPSIATIIFNILSFFFEHYSTIPLPRPTESVYDVSVGCAFSLIGIAVTAKDREITRKLVISFVVILFLILSGFLIPVFLGWPKLYTVWAINIISIFLLSWAIVVSD
jgi:hypothetical protein